MKKLSLATFLALSTFSVATLANQGGFQDPNQAKAEQTQVQAQKEHKGKKHGKHHEKRGGGFVNSQQAVSPVSEAGQWKDDQFVLLEGNIVEQVGKEDYLFKDASGQINVEIDRHVFRDQIITPNDKVKIYAEVDKSWNKTEVEAKHLELVK